MNEKQNKKHDKRKLTKVRGYPGIYKILHWDEGPKKYVDGHAATRKGSKYRAFRWVKVLGKRVQQAQNFFAIDEAREWRMESAPAVVPAKPSTYSIGVLIRDWREWSKPPRLAQSTWQIYAKDLIHFEPLFEIAVENLTAEDVDQWLKILIDPNNPKKNTRVSYLREVKTLTTILNWYREYKNPRFYPPFLKRHRRDCFFREKAGRPDISLSVENLERFLDRLKNRHRPVYYYLASFQALSGVRIGEACGLQWDCIDLKNATADIRRVCFWDFKTKSAFLREGTKTGERRTVVLAPRLIEIIKEWQELNTDGPFVFHKEGKPLRYPAIQNAYKKAFRALGLPIRSTHVLRHTFASIFSDQTNDIRGTQAALGHRDLRITQHYAKVAERTQRQAMLKFELGKVRTEDETPTPERGKVISLTRRRT